MTNSHEESAKEVWTAIVALTHGNNPMLKIEWKLLEDLFNQAKKSENCEYEFDMLNELLQHHLALFSYVQSIDLLTGVIGKKWNLTQTTDIGEYVISYFVKE